jgi:hypothetical protein
MQSKLLERDATLSERQAQILDLHTELSQMHRVLQTAPGDPVQRSLSYSSPTGASRNLLLGNGLRWSSRAGAGLSSWGGAANGCCSPGRQTRPGSPGRSAAGMLARSGAEEVMIAATEGGRWWRSFPPAACNPPALSAGHGPCIKPT